MTALPPDAVADLYKLVAELEQRLDSSFAAHDAAIASQAATARENARLRNELGVARERQNAAAEILSTIANASGDAEASLQRIAETTARLFDAASVSIRVVDGNEWGLSIRFGAGSERIAATVPAEQRRVRSRNLPGTVFRENRQIHIPDLDNIDPEMANWPVTMARAAGIRTVAGTPLRREGKAIGALVVFRDRLAPFTDDELALQQSFADQAAIALENARLFNETTEALERQTATSDILKVIANSPSDIQPVFAAIATSANRLIGGFATAVFRFLDGNVHLTAFTPVSPAADAALQTDFPRPVDDYPPYQMARLGRPFPIPDTEEAAHAPIKDIARLHGFRSMLHVPLMNGDVPFGIITVTRLQPGPFAEHDVQLLQTFADQAVIAIENARLFNETREALERQTATSDILKVIASSPSDVQPVFDAIAASANSLLGGFTSAVYSLIDDMQYLSAFTPINPVADAALQALYPRPLSLQPWAEQTRNGEIVHVPDIEADPTVPAKSLDAWRMRGFRSFVRVPLLRDRATVGMISVTRAEPGPFVAHHIELLQTFADQAVIAIENVRLFNETKEALERQTATSDILKVIASSPSDVQPVFDVIVERAVRLCGARMGRVYRYDGELIHLVGGHGLSVPARDSAERPFPRPASDDTIVGRVMLARRANILADLDEDDTVPPLSRQMISALGARSQVTMPMLLAGAPIGAITLSWAEPRGYTDQTIALLQTFADQAVIAIENVRLFNDVKERTEDLSESLQQQTAVGDVLKTISRSTFDLQPVLDTLVNTAALLCNADMAFLMRREGELYRAGAAVGFSSDYIEFLRSNPLRVDRGSITGRAVLERRTVHILDVATDPEYRLRESTTLAGVHTALCVPLLRENEPIGTIVLARQRVEAFTQKQIDLVTTFADQAVIAIENVRLFDQLRQRTEDLGESLQQQTATADVLKVISRSAFDLQAVLDTLTESAAHLCNADMGAIARKDERGFYHATNYNFAVDWVRFTDIYRLQPGRGSVIGRALLANAAVQIPDVLADPEYVYSDMQQAAGYRTLLGVPMLRGKEPIGVLFLGRKTVDPFTDKQIELVQTFADQAVIAIENVRLFDEVQAKTRDLTEALTYQTGSGKILSVIASSPTEVGPVLNAIVESACELCEAYDAVVLLKDGDHLRFSAHHGPIGVNIESWPIGRGWTAGRAFLDRAPVHVHDMLSDEGAEFPDSRELSRYTGTAGMRTILAVPLLSENESIGTILLRRTEVQSFSDKQIALLQTFADQAVIAIGNVRLFDEVQAKTRDLTEALTYQTGSGNILKVIASSPTDVGPVLRAIVESSCELCGAYDAVLRLKDGDLLRLGAHHGPIPVNMELWTINRNWTAGRAVLDRSPVHVHDLLSEEGEEFPEARDRALTQGHRTILSVPLTREGESIGAITLRRTEVNPFSDKQIALLQTFADQAVIAIGNVRLFEEVQAKTRDLTEALTYQTGSANILKVIASSPTDVGPVLNAIVVSACELCESYDAVLRLRDGDVLRFSAHQGPVTVRHEDLPINRNWTVGRAVIDRVPIHVEDMFSAAGDDFPDAQIRAREHGQRTVLSVPLLREGESIGAIMLRRLEVNPFSDKQIALLQTFADQAVIAIGNVRLFEEVQAKTRDLSETLEQQTATADVLKVISRSPDALQPVLDAIVETSRALCHSDASTIFLIRDNRFHLAAVSGSVPAHLEFLRANPMALDERGNILARVVREKRTLHYPNVADDPELSQGTTGLGGPRALVTVPLMRDGDVIGAITLRQSHLKPFTARQIEAIETFADQAVIAISNVGLFEEVQARTRDLTESLQQQTATADVLKVISTSPGELEPVFEAMQENAVRLCEAQFAMVFLYEENQFRAVGRWNLPTAYGEFLGENTILADPNIPLGRVAMTKQPVQIADVLVDQSYIKRFPGIVAVAELGGARTLLQVPMLKDNELVGTIGIYRQEVRPFTEKQIALVRNFAAQAVIAIENARLLNELHQRTDDLTESLQQQTATSEVLKVISSSPGELEPVFRSMLENAVSICDAQFGNLLLVDGDRAHWEAGVGTPPKLAEFFTQSEWFQPTPGSHVHRVMRTKQVSHTADDTAEAVVGAAARLGGARSTVCVPMVKDDALVGTIFIYRTEVRPFTDKQIDLVKNFAAQAVIAIENTRLLRELRQRTDDLTKSLDDLRTAQDRLVQTEKLASLGQLTAGIAHEIKNPLNFVNNFAALSAELTDELNDVLKQATIAEKIREEVNDLTALLKANLQKVVQHGKRADSIVKNMLLHSREGSGDHRPADINALVDESLNLAYHGARAEKPDFNVTLQRDFDADAGMIEVFPQEITRVFLNLVSNGFYAVTRRRSEHGPGFDPVLSAATRNLGDAVEIRIRDNGTGIPQDVKDKMFNPFFTTKPAGEGTGLGLSMSHDIIVKQHGGTIDVDTEPGQFTEFRIVLPRISKSSK